MGGTLIVRHTVAQAGAFAHDPGLKEAMERSGVTGNPRIEIFEDV